MEEQAENRNKRKLNIDWEEVLPGRNDDVPAELIVKKSGPPTPAQKSVPMSDDPGSGEELDRQIPDQELGVRIARMKDTYSKVRHCLPDKGKKILATVTRLEKECERRRLAGAVPVCLVRLQSLFVYLFDLVFCKGSEEVHKLKKRIENFLFSLSLFFFF